MKTLWVLSVLLALSLAQNVRTEFESDYVLTSPSFNGNRGQMVGKFYYSWNQGAITWTGTANETLRYTVDRPSEGSLCNIPFCPQYITSSYNNVTRTLNYKFGPQSSLCGLLSLWEGLIFDIPACVDEDNISFKSTPSGCKGEKVARDYRCLSYEGIENKNVFRVTCPKGFPGVSIDINMPPAATFSADSVIVDSGMIGASAFGGLSCGSCPQNVFTCGVKHSPKWRIKDGSSCGCEIGKPNTSQPILWYDPLHYAPDPSTPLPVNTCKKYIPLPTVKDENKSVKELWWNEDAKFLCRAILSDGRDFTFKNVIYHQIASDKFDSVNNSISYPGDYSDTNNYWKWRDYCVKKPRAPSEPRECGCSKPFDIALVLDLTLTVREVELQRAFANIFIQSFDVGSLKTQFTVSYTDANIYPPVCSLFDGVSHKNVYSSIFGLDCCPPPSWQWSKENSFLSADSPCCSGTQPLGSGIAKAVTGLAKSTSGKQRVVVATTNGKYGDETLIKEAILFAKSKNVFVVIVVVGDSVYFPNIISDNYVLFRKTDFLYLRRTVLELTAIICERNTKGCNSSCCGECVCGKCSVPDQCQAVPGTCETIKTANNPCCNPTPCTVPDGNQCLIPACNNGTCTFSNKTCPLENDCYTYACDPAQGCVATFKGGRTPCQTDECQRQPNGSYAIVSTPQCVTTNRCITLTCNATTNTCVATANQPPTPPNPCQRATCDPATGTFTITNDRYTAGPCETITCDPNNGTVTRTPIMCRVPEDGFCDSSYCDPATSMCVSNKTVCQDPNPANLCRSLSDQFPATATRSRGCNPMTGLCDYDEVRLCAPRGCQNEVCNGMTGQCMTVPTPSCTNDNRGCQNPRDINTNQSSCVVTMCTAFHCSAAVGGGGANQNCNAQVSVDCTTGADFCKTSSLPVICDDDTGCLYTYTNCSNVLPPLPCQDRMADPTLPFCCRYVNRTCDSPCFRCDATVDQCVSICPADNPCQTSQCVVDENNQAVCRTTTTPCVNNDPCFVSTGCNTTTGTCDYTEKVCNDNDMCTIDKCTNGNCDYTDTLTCNDHNPCTTDTCDPQTGCVFTQLTCDDNNACTTDSCDVNQGCLHFPTNCDDNNYCTTDTCNPQTGVCSNVPRVCNDNNPCTNDTCDRYNGCQYSVYVCPTPDWGDFQKGYSGNDSQAAKSNPNTATCITSSCQVKGGKAVCVTEKSPCYAGLTTEWVAAISTGVAAASVIGIVIGVVVAVLIAGGAGGFVAYNHWWGDESDVVRAGQNPIFQPVRSGQGDNPLRQGFNDVEQQSVSVTDSDGGL